MSESNVIKSYLFDISSLNEESFNKLLGSVKKYRRDKINKLAYTHNKYLSLGGKLYLNTPIDEFIVEEKRINGAKSKNQIIIGDTYISALDVNYTLKKLLKDKYHTRTYNYLNKNIKKNPISSSFCVYVRTTKDVSYIDTPTCIRIPKIKVGKRKIDSLLIRPYGFDTEYKYIDGSTVISLFVDQNQDDYHYFKHLENYKKEEDRIVKELISSFEEAYPL